VAYYFIELYTPKQAWLDMPMERRGAVMESIRSALSTFSNLGVETLFMGKCEQGVAHGTHHPYLAILKFDDANVRRELMAGIETCGWYDYFDHINAASCARDSGLIPPHFARLVNLAPEG